MMAACAVQDCLGNSAGSQSKQWAGEQYHGYWESASFEKPCISHPLLLLPYVFLTGACHG
jgi:hypothetical protein